MIVPTTEGGCIDHVEAIEAPDNEEADKLKFVPDPGQPTEKQLEEHRQRGHIPFRTWCTACRAGRGRAGPHRCRRPGEPRAEVPVICADYWYLGGTLERPVLTMEDEDSAEHEAAADAARAQGLEPLDLAPEPDGLRMETSS